VIVILAVIVAAIRTGDYYDLKLIGLTYIDLGEPLKLMWRAPIFGYWFACALAAMRY
jgi:hypothetical protein